MTHSAIIAACTQHPCLFEQDPPFEEWKAQGSPHLWHLGEEARGYQAWADYAYGMVAMTRGEELVGIATRHIIDETVVLINKDYYGTHNYLFFPS